MMRYHLKFYYLLVLCLSFTTINPSAQNDDPFAPIEDNPDLPRVLIIGDSISIGYTIPVREQLDGITNVHRIPENGGPTSRGMQKISEWLGDGDWDIIHFNWGLHDIKYMEDGKHQVSIRDYESNLIALVKAMKETGAKLIWASTTPVPEGDLSPKRVPGDEVAYNKVAENIMKMYKIKTNDLYSFAKERLDEIQRPENVHFTEEGSKLLGKKVASIIKETLKEKQ